MRILPASISSHSNCSQYMAVAAMDVLREGYFLTSDWRGRCHRGTLGAWCSPQLCHGWKTFWSAQRTRQGPRSFWSAAHRKSCFCFCCCGMRAVHPSSSVWDTKSWWSPLCHSKQKETRLVLVKCSRKHYKRFGCLSCPWCLKLRLHLFLDKTAHFSGLLDWASCAVIKKL